MSVGHLATLMVRGPLRSGRLAKKVVHRSAPKIGAARGGVVWVRWHLFWCLVPAHRSPWRTAARRVGRVLPGLAGRCGGMIASLHDCTTPGHPALQFIAPHCSAMHATMQRPTPVLPQEVGGAGTICVFGADARGRRASVRAYMGELLQMAARIWNIFSDARRHLVHVHQMRALERRRAPGCQEWGSGFEPL